MPSDAENLVGQKKDGTPGKKAGAADKQNSMNGNDFAKAIGINKPANVRDKIKRWQQEVEPDVVDTAKAGAPASDDPVNKPAASPKPQPTPKTRPLEEKPNWTPKHTPSRSVDVSPERPQSAKKQPVAHNVLDDDLLTATAPKKRVISDSHWRSKQSPPKDNTRPAPKTIPNAWVRPSKIIKKDKPPNEDEKAVTPNTPPLNPLLPLVAYVGKSTGQKKPSQRQRRPSKPSSSENEQRPTSSGSGSGKDPKSEDNVDAPTSPPPEKEKTEIVKVRRRRRAQTSPRASLSADDVAPYAQRPARKSDTSLSGDPMNIVTVEYDEESKITSPRDNEIRERRRRRRPRSQGDATADESPRNPIATAPRRRRSRRSYPKSDEEAVVTQAVDPTPDTPPNKAFPNRLEAWLSGTPDPFMDADSRRRRKSKDSVSTLETPPKEDISDITLSTDKTKDEPAEESQLRRTGSGSRRRRRRRSREMKIDTQIVDETPSTIVSEDTVETPAQEKESEVSLTPTPTLRRRGAKRSQHSPTKSRSMSSPLRETTSVDDANKENVKEVDDASSAFSSSVDASAIDMENIPLRPRPLAMQRIFPSTGKRLSTIASVESFGTKAQGAPPSEALGSEAVTTISEETRTISEVPASELGSQLNADTSTIVSRRSTRRKRLANHADLISVLSMPKAGTKSIVSARSIRTNRSRLATATISDIMRELTSDETKYMRELRTIVDGVIPVLLSCVLSKSDSAVAAGLFSRSANTDPSNVTKPIVDMGVCLERLKTLHKRVPKEDSDAFVSWAQSAQRVYSDYIAAWRLGFQDVVISLAPADDDPFKPAKVVNGPEDGAPWDEGMPRNAEGYVINGDGERVDVAYMLKRPLVRLKYLAKSLKGINHVKPSERAEKMSNTFQDLVAAARKRSNDEQARLEDEAAAAIDATRTRDPRSLAPLAGVRVDPTRCVRARDHFDLHLYHSSGQEVSCRVEVLLRDDAPGTGKGGDLLFCEVDPTGRWLLLPPIQQNRVSARNGDLKGEIIVMIRGYQNDGSEWSEVMSLTTDEEQAGFEWVQMLGLHPIPLQIAEVRKNQSKVPRPTSSHASSSLLSAATASTLPLKSRTPSPREIEIPIGEQHTEVSKVWHYDTPDRRQRSHTASPITPPSGDNSQVSTTQDPKEKISPETQTQPQQDLDRTPRSLNEAIQMAGAGSPTNLKRTRAKRLSRNPTSSPNTPRPSRQITLDDPSELVDGLQVIEEEIKPSRKLTKRRPQSLPAAPSAVSQSSKGFSVWMPSSEVGHSDESDDDKRSVEDEAVSPPDSPPTSPQRPHMHRRVSSVPSMELPSIPKSRKTSQPTTPVKDAEVSLEKIREVSASAPSKLQKKRPEPVRKENVPLEREDDKPPPVPPHRSPSPATPVTLKGSETPVFTPTLLGFKNKRRSSSPLKHEYEPSTCTELSSESEEDVASEEDNDDDDQESLTSESSEDELDDDVPMPLMPINSLRPRGYAARPYSAGRDNRRTSNTERPEDEGKGFPKVSPPSSIYTLPNGTITPSQSASNTPYRAVPQGSGRASKAIASIFAWSDAGRWDSLHPDECSVVVTPGKIEVFEITANHSKPFLADGDEIIQTEGRAPLVAVELTPLVPLRKSTAIDISIRSPPTAESQIRTGNNIMLRSRNATECAQLYAMINQSRINNPTYIALQNARGPYGHTSWAEAMDRQNAARTNSGSSSGWLGGTLGRRSSYRKTSTRAASISAATESSVGTMNTALRSALGRFSFGKSGVFSIRNSTLGSRSTGSSFDSGSNSNPGSGSSTPNGTGEPGRAPGAPAGITNTKCRLYERETLKKWRDMGSARLTIMLPSPHPSAPSSPTNPLQRSPGKRDHTQERRILVTGKTNGEVLLDVTLSESCFERVARSGIAVSVWEDTVGENGEVGRVAKTGGVSGARARVFMVQMKSERECAYCFSLLGKLRY
ncbi:Nn.00g009530.m01.CDS01 [Neocucurbitaria sp. VM-36]